MVRAITILLLLSTYAVQNLHCQNQLHGDSWKQCKQNGKGTIIVYWHVVEPATYLIDGHLEGIEVDLMRSFQRFIADNYNIDLEIEWIKIDSFDELLAKLSSKDAKGEFGTGNISITEDRKKLIRFSLPFLPDMNLLVSSTDIPIVSTAGDFSDKFLDADAITIKNSTLESDLEFIKENHLTNFQFRYANINDDLIQVIASGPKKFGYIDASVYLHWVKKRSCH